MSEFVWSQINDVWEDGIKQESNFVVDLHAWLWYHRKEDYLWIDAEIFSWRKKSTIKHVKQLRYGI